MARVVILDDDLKALAIVRHAVRSAGHEPIAVTSAVEAAVLLDAVPAPEILLAAPAADAGEGLLLAARVAAGDLPSRTAVLLLGDAPLDGPPLQRIALPVEPIALAARIADALASLSARRAAPARMPARPAADPVASAASQPPAPEASLRALFRRSPPAAGAPPRAAPAADVRDFRARLSAAPQPVQAAVELAALEELARSADYFRVLGLPHTATGAEIRDAAARLLADIDARALAPAEGTQPLDDVRQVVLDARDVLGDDALRARYLEGIGADVPGPPDGGGPGVANVDPS